MDGVAAVRAALIRDDAMIALIPADRIGAGPIGLGGVLPSIALASISSVDRNTVAPGARRHVRERVQVMIQARNYREQKAVLRAVRRAAADRIDIEVDGISAVTIHTETAGPDFLIEEPAIWCQPQDFLVTYQETR